MKHGIPIKLNPITKRLLLDLVVAVRLSCNSTDFLFHFYRWLQSDYYKLTTVQEFASSERIVGPSR